MSSTTFGAFTGRSLERKQSPQVVLVFEGLGSLPARTWGVQPGSEAREVLKAHPTSLSRCSRRERPPPGPIPTVKPVAMLGDSIRDVTERADTILDPFARSG